MINKVIAGIILLLFVGCNQKKYTIDVTDFGARGKKTQLATKNIQRAIDQCYKNGGGIVFFPPGEYLTGTLRILSNVTLHLEAGATLYASQNEKDFETTYKIYKKNDSGKKGKGETPVLIYALDAKNIGITGNGTIHGQAQRTYEDLKETDGFIAAITDSARAAGVEMKMYYKVKPYTCMIFLERCTNIKIQNISLIESTDWTLHFKWCNKIFVDNIYLYSSLEKGVNADGIDIDGCHDVAITNSIIETGDDAIVLKTTQTDTTSLSCENVVVNNCILTSTSTALKLGTESFADFRNITFSNCVIRNSNRGLSVVIRDGGTAENILFSNITVECNRKHFNWWGNGDPLWLVLLKRTPESRLGMIRNVCFENIIAHGQGTSRIEGFDGKPLENIRLSNVQFFMHPEEYKDKRADHCFAAHHINNLRLENVDVFWDKKKENKWENAFHFDNINTLRLDNLSGTQAHIGKGAMISMHNVNDAIVERCKPMAGTNIFCSITGQGSQNVILSGNFTDNVAMELLKDNEVKAVKIK
mgnify:CR=1 FL=1